MFRRSRPAVWLLFGLCLATTLPLAALVPPEKESVAAGKQLRHPDLTIPDRFDAVSELPAQAAERARQDLAALGAPAATARIDARSGRFVTLTPSRPLIPGAGQGNDLTWRDLGEAPPQDRDALERAAGKALARYLRNHARQLHVDPDEISQQEVTTVQDDLVQIFVQRTVGDVPVRDSYLNAVLSHGNLVLLGAHRWGAIDVSTEPTIALKEATATVESHAAPRTASGTWGKGELILVPLARGRDVGRVPLGRGYIYRLAWSVKTAFEGEPARFEGLVDAHTGELLAFEDTNHYAEAKGGVLPVCNDAVPPGGIEQPGWPMPFLNISTASGTVTADSGGNFTASGTGTSSLAGPFIRMSDSCGTISLSSTGDLDFGASGGTDCVTPGFGGGGNTHASRSEFYELNRIKEMARGQLTANTWLAQQLTSNVNINSTCNAFWNGSTVNFYRSGGGCSNTGEIAGVFNHEWGHGMDANDATPGVSNPGEGIADLYAALRLNNSCIGCNFRPGIQCGGYGDPCLDCTGVRDIDWAEHALGQPHDVSWAIASCGGSVHCRGYVYSEAVWDLWKRDLPAQYGMDDNAAGEVVTRLTYLGAGGVGTWYADTPPFGGCSASGGYLNYLAADDDNGNLNDGTPHMTAIFAAFDRHEAACGTPAVQDSGCAGTPSAAPSLTATPSDKSASLSWTAVAGTTTYEVLRTDGVFGCAFGKTKIASTAGTSFNDSGLQNGRDYSYVVIPKGPSAACFGPASACVTVRPLAGPNLAIDATSALLTLADGDDDEFLDNCETGTLTFGVRNTGLGTLTNVRIAGVTSPSHPTLRLLTPFPAPVSPSTLAEGAGGSGSLDFISADSSLAFGDTVTFRVEVAADELPMPKTGVLTVSSTENDFTHVPSLIWDFEAGTDGWTVIQGTFNRTSTGGGAQGTAWYEQSSANLDHQCDHIRSPVISLNSTSTLSLWSQFDIEPRFTNGVWYDRANVGIHQVTSGTRTPVNPDGGRLYNASGPEGTCGTAGQQGWADAATTWGESTWSAGALGSAGFAGQQVQLDIRYGTDASLNGFGFRFDQLTLTNVDVQGPDTQPDDFCTCSNDLQCDDGLFCNGRETCDLDSGQCQGGPAPCAPGELCKETVDLCQDVTGCLHIADFETGAGGWTGGVSSCTTGFFVVGRPEPTTCQPDGPTNAFFTASNPTGADGIDDVDGGTCEALSPVIDATGFAAVEVGLDYFHCQRDAGDDPSDGFTIEVRNNGVVVDTLVSIGDVANNPVWTTASTVVNNPGTLGLRVQATDGAGSGDIVEAGIDNVWICPGQPCAVDDDLEAGAPNWFNDVSADCITGDYVTGNPTETASGGKILQIGGSHSGVSSIFTATNTSLGVDDVDGGKCILRSPAWNVANASTLSLWYWHGQRDAGDDPGDFFRLEYTIDGGVTWNLMSTIGDVMSSAAWTNATAQIPAGSQVQLRMQCSDGPAAGDIIECGIDDVSICDN